MVKPVATRFSLALGLLVLAPLLGGCGSATVRVVAKDGASGRIELRGAAERMHEMTDEYLRRECAGDYTVLDETPSDGDTWRVDYRCEHETQRGAQALVVFSSRGSL